VLAPSAVLTPAATLVVAAHTRTTTTGGGFPQLALGLVVAAIAIGAGHQSRVTLSAQRAIERDDPGEARRQLVRWVWGYAVVVALLAVIAWDMVFKPGL